ncbi:MAG: hypothetical protein K6T55_09150 [Syntrophobacterales bacterium]|nr:hypothetical protein [Syntrophobacterales bacterium]
MSDHPRELKKLLKDLCPLVDLVREMLGSARHAFNRHSRAELDKMARLHTEFSLKIDPFFQRVEEELEKPAHHGKAQWLLLKEVLSRLELLAHEISRLAEPLQQKANRGAILSDQDLFQVNDAFSRLTGMLRTLADVFATDDPALKAYIRQECERLEQECFGHQAAHQGRMMDSPGQPGAWAVYVALLQRFRDCIGHLRPLVESLG